MKFKFSLSPFYLLLAITVCGISISEAEDLSNKDTENTNEVSTESPADSKEADEEVEDENEDENETPADTTQDSAAPTEAQSLNKSKANSIYDLAIEDLLQMPVTTVSKSEEKLEDTPATVIVITREDIDSRGYTDLSKILDDLPGMDVVRPYGDVTFKTYWRGYRNFLGDPFILMLDGVIYNNLYFNQGEILAVFPMSNVEKVEIVYGPASSIYGSNASMGVINVITRNERGPEGATRGKVIVGSNAKNVADINYFYQGEKIKLSLTARVDYGFVDSQFTNNYEFTNSKYYSSFDIWGQFTQNSNIGGSFSSPNRNYAGDLRVSIGEWEAAAQYFKLSTGYGLEYAADKVQNNEVWDRPELTVYVRNRHSYSSSLFSTTLLRYRESNVSNDSTFLDAYVNADNQFVAAYSFWQVNASSWSLFHDMEYRPVSELILNGGIYYELKNLQKAYDNPYGNYVPSSATSYSFPIPPVDAEQGWDRIHTSDSAYYLQGKYLLTDNHQFTVGARYNLNSVYGASTTARGGYVGTFNKFHLKLLYGQAIQDPTPRLLYGAWKGSGVDPALKPERSQNFEASTIFGSGNFSTSLSGWYVINDQTIVQKGATSRNLGTRWISGLDFGLQAKFDAGAVGKIRLWSYYSHLFSAIEQKFDNNFNYLGNGSIGDLAMNKFWIGSTLSVTDQWEGTLRGRWMGGRETVDTNPLGFLPPYSVFDAQIGYKNILGKGTNFYILINNIFDAQYAEPGVSLADAGNTPLALDSNGNYIAGGSSGYYSSMLIGSGRTYNAILKFQL